jgi:hypothetical protein
MPLDKNKFMQYAALEMEKRKIEEQQKDLKPEILAMIEENGQGVEVEGIGTFSKGERKKWTYTSFVQESEAALAERKKEEEQNGNATYDVQTVYPIFKPLK